MTIGELERASGVPRSTIYYYVRDGLLPVAQKTAASRAVYAEEHLELLREITRLKAEGLPLDAIKQRVAPLVETMTAANLDTASEHSEQVRQAILRAAARLFSRQGYKSTRVSDIIEAVGITPRVLYSHFPSKQDLFVEAFDVFIEWMRLSQERTMPRDGDAVTRELNRVQSYYFGIKSVGGDLLSLVRSEAVRKDGDLRDSARDTLKHMLRDLLDDLAALRAEHGVETPMPDELVSFGLFGAAESIVMRACWDDAFSPDDVLWTVCGLLLGIKAIYSGHLDFSEYAREYADNVRRLAKGPEHLPVDELL